MNSLRVNSFLVAVWLLLALPLVGCKGSNPKKEAGNAISLTTMEGAKSIQLSQAGKQFFLRLTSSASWQLVADEKAFFTFTPSQGEKGEHSIVVAVEANKGKERKSTLTAKSTSGEAVATFAIAQQGASSTTPINPDDPVNPDDPINPDDPVNPDDPEKEKQPIYGDTTLLELPRLSGKKSDYFVTHRVNGGRVVNYSMEYNVEAYHTRWVCFSFDDETKQINTKRSNAWGWDPLVPSRYKVTRADFEKGVYARGHLVASHDRVFSREANIQTFYYTNMSPQRHEFNEGIWLQMERYVQGKGRSLRKGEMLYVAKGGTIRPDQIEARRSNNKIVVPKYYWMALLKKSGQEWSAMAFLVEHSQLEKVSRLLPYAISVDELEEFTGLDFFFNLPDEVENQVETQQPSKHLDVWGGL